MRRHVTLAVLCLMLAATAALPQRTPGTANAAPIDPRLPGLRDRLAQTMAGWGGANAVSVTDLQTGETVSVNGSTPLPAACTIKIFIMFAVAQDIEAGKYTEADVADLVQGAMGPSATWPARELIRIIGGNDVGAGVHRVNKIMWDLGAKQSILTHPPDYPGEEYGYKASRGIVENLLVADELNMMLGKLYRGEALSPWATQYVLWSMTLAIPGQQQSLGGPLPPDAQLYHKIGLVYAPQETWNDAGIVTFERGGNTYAYAITYLGSYGGSWLDAYYHGAAVSAIAWRAFSSAYASGPAANACFPETGRCIEGPFYWYWLNNGGLARQGLPLTNAFDERDRTTGQTFRVQYFERARFEYHPEGLDTGYAVLLGQVGRAVYTARYPRGRPASTTSPGGHCFEATGRCVDSTFYAYWNANGGLDQFGYPLSDQFSETDPATGQTYQVQYFERARFEQHPEVGGPSGQVLLGLLGVSELQARYPGGVPGDGLAAASLPATPAMTETMLGAQLADYERFWLSTPHGDPRQLDLGWSSYDRQLERFLATRPELGVYLVWYYRARSYDADLGLAYHPPAATLREPALIAAFLAAR